jgi:hypothetical protein
MKQEQYFNDQAKGHNVDMGQQFFAGPPGMASVTGNNAVGDN